MNQSFRMEWEMARQFVWNGKLRGKVHYTCNYAIALVIHVHRGNHLTILDMTNEY